MQSGLPNSLPSSQSCARKREPSGAHLLAATTKITVVCISLASGLIHYWAAPRADGGRELCKVDAAIAVLIDVREEVVCRALLRLRTCGGRGREEWREREGSTSVSHTLAFPTNLRQHGQAGVHRRHARAGVVCNGQRIRAAAQPA